MGGAGNDSITLTENASTSAADVVQVSAVVGTSSDSARVAVTGNDNDTGQDTLTGFDFAADTILITATNVNNFTHGTTDVVAGTATGGIDTGAQGSFTTSTVIWNLDKTAAVLGADAGDVVISFSGSTSAGASATFAASSVLARSQYVLTASTTAATIGGGDLADSITGGAGADSLSGGLGADTIVAGSGQDVVNLSEGTASADVVVFSSAFAAGNANAATITGFSGGAGLYKIDIGFALTHGSTTNAAGTGTTNTIAASAPVTVTNNGAPAGANAGLIFLLSGAGDQMAASSTAANAVANAVTAMTSTTDFAAANVATGDTFIVVLDDGTNSFVFRYVADGTAATTSAADLELIGIINGTSDAGLFATGNFI